MEQTIKYIELSLIIICFLSSIALLIFYLRCKETKTDYDKLIKEMTKQTEDNLKTLKEGNKKINKIEEEIAKCKKQLGWKLFQDK